MQKLYAVLRCRTEAKPSAYSSFVDTWIILHKIPAKHAPFILRCRATAAEGERNKICL